jgi:hypothetical protein
MTGDIYYGLWYPVIVAGMTLVIGTLFLRETRGSPEAVRAATRATTG